VTPFPINYLKRLVHIRFKQYKFKLIDVFINGILKKSQFSRIFQSPKTALIPKAFANIVFL